MRIAKFWGANKVQFGRCRKVAILITDRLMKVQLYIHLYIPYDSDKQ